MEFLRDNWYMIIIFLCLAVGVGIAIWRFCLLSDEEKYAQVRGWLLQAVILAEQEYGSGTGKMKLSAVYDAFCSALPWIARALPFEKFSAYVDDALAEAKALLAQNKDIAALAETMIAEKNTEDFVDA